MWLGEFLPICLSGVLGLPLGLDLSKVVMNLVPRGVVLINKVMLVRLKPFRS